MKSILENLSFDILEDGVLIGGFFYPKRGKSEILYSHFENRLLELEILSYRTSEYKKYFDKCRTEEIEKIWGSLK